MKQWLKRWALSIAMCLVILVTATVSLVLWLGSGNDGAVHVGTPAATTVKSAPAGPVEVTTPYFTTQLPAGFVVKIQDEQPSTVQTQLHLVANIGSPTDEQFATTISAMPPEGLTSIGNYILRTTDATTYEPFSPASLPAGATAFRTLRGPAGFVVFWPHGSYCVEIALSTDGGASSEQLQTTFAQAISSWRWK